MLSQFTVKNYKSIRDETTFDMQATSISEHIERVIVDRDNQKFLPISAIYGPNGGGKSNVLEAIYTLHSEVMRPIFATKIEDASNLRIPHLPVKPFAFSDESKNAPTLFEIFFRTKIAEYRYVLHIKNDNIIFESLDRIKIDTGRVSALFTRTENDIVLKGDIAKLKISEDISSTLPLLSYLGITYTKNEIIKDILEWFEESIVFLNYGNPRREMRTAIASSKEIKELVLKMIRELDLDIEDYYVDEKDDNHIEVYTKHIVNGYSTNLNLNEESNGTKKLFGLLPFIANSIVHGTTLVIDELDAKIHPILLKYIISLFNDLSVNRNGAQLIFTSHDLSTMNNSIFRRDEIWFVAKGNEQNSRLYSLVEFKNEDGESVRKDSKFDKQYLEGKYGADPYLKKIIDWSEINA